MIWRAVGWDPPVGLTIKNGLWRRLRWPRRVCSARSWGFSRWNRQAPVFYGLVAVGTIGGTARSLLHLNPIKLLILVAVINGVAAAAFPVVVICVAGSAGLIGDSVNGNVAKILGRVAAAILAAAAIALFATGGAASDPSAN